MPKVIIYGSSSDRKKIASLIESEGISIVSTEGSTYQQERNFLYGNSEYGHAVAVICISGKSYSIWCFKRGHYKKKITRSDICKNNENLNYFQYVF